MQTTIYLRIVYETGFFIDVKNLFSAPLRLVFLDVYIQCVFYRFHIKFACFVICENYFSFFTCVLKELIF